MEATQSVHPPLPIFEESQLQGLFGTNSSPTPLNNSLISIHSTQASSRFLNTVNLDTHLFYSPEKTANLSTSIMARLSPLATLATLLLLINYVCSTPVSGSFMESLEASPRLDARERGVGAHCPSPLLSTVALNLDQDPSGEYRQVTLFLIISYATTSGQLC